MTARNWTKARLRQQIVQRGTESIAGDYVPAALRDRRRTASKEELRRMADELLKNGPAPVRYPTRNRSWPSKPRDDRPTPTKPPRGRSFSAKGAPSGLDVGLVVFADGCCEPNPGSGGWAFCAYRDGVEIYSACGGDLATTNQRMELTAAVRALRWILERGEPCRLLCDSQYVVKGCNEWRHGWKRSGWQRKGDRSKPENRTVANLQLWKDLDEVLTAMPLILEWVRGHSGVAGNERADELSLIGREQAFENQPLSPIEQQLAYRS